jgi:adenosine deaminase
VGLDSSEARASAGEVRARVREARRLGLRAVAHAGEEGPPAYILAARSMCSRSNASTTACSSVKDADLMQRLALERIPLTVCPLSNVKLCVFKTMRRAQPEATARCRRGGTINSDDPAYFGGYMNQNWLETFAALELDASHAITLAREQLRGQLPPARAQARLARAARCYCRGFV